MTATAPPASAWLLVTGSRDWRHRTQLDAALDDAWGQAQLAGHSRLTVVHGGATGADVMAARWAVRTAGVLELPFEARWSEPCRVACTAGHRRKRRDGSTYCPAAGVHRNQRMVDHVRHQRGWSLVVAFFSTPDSVGTADCLRRAVAAGLLWRRVDAEVTR